MPSGWEYGSGRPSVITAATTSPFITRIGAGGGTEMNLPYRWSAPGQPGRGRGPAGCRLGVNAAPPLHNSSVFLGRFSSGEAWINDAPIRRVSRGA